MKTQNLIRYAWPFLLLASVTIAACTREVDNSTVASNEDRIARGEYLITVCGCVDCHTPGTLYGVPDFSRQLSGSELGWQGDFGVSFARNLTPDEVTGIGSWTEAEIVRAMRTGMRPDGTQLLPPMPWPNLTRMTDEDAYAIAAYLKSLPPIEHRVPDAVPSGETPPPGLALVVFPPPPAWDVEPGE